MVAGVGEREHLATALEEQHGQDLAVDLRFGTVELAVGEIGQLRGESPLLGIGGEGVALDTGAELEDELAAEPGGDVGEAEAEQRESLTGAASPVAARDQRGAEEGEGDAVEAGVD